VKGKEVWGGQVADAIEKALLLSKDVMIWQEDSSERLVENMKRDSVLVSFQTLYFRIYYTQAR
jgi:hypothetical protein